MKKLQMLLFSTIFLAAGLSFAQDSPEGSWLKVSPDQSWVIYSFAQDGTFSRANNKAPNAQALGRYIIKKDMISFIDNPDDYQPVGFEIKTGECNGYEGPHLTLYNPVSKVDFGCFVKIN
ncbi:hypothetical protein MMG00_00160 [Ignatzschineria rhizosphaerae]|uniref:DUF2147 domain-containing protein n=1 Tax=Ignatzschineria rhizosphaerae TaxID=2923279 RepID=A0ABY3X0B6_9GAMM|nr:hypothetical protein [Ignatzschineria rhizosphaerae]UNM96339.1 hypothetical protein MMG00_00160 [Ignatzschineria rhizosphaerae]